MTTDQEAIRILATTAAIDHDRSGKPDAQSPKPFAAVSAEKQAAFDQVFFAKLQDLRGEASA